ncbi:glycosyltransferase [Nocardioides currus]|uniref:glycosyltransferase n=1 Tax=Nocardioides currus TaxID=2133958 RepID=UPI0014033400|nr:glycosyltransferase [Nocardioides currus]
MSTPLAVAVVIPARDEEALLPGCLDSVSRAVRALGREHPEVRCRTFVVLDSCHDGTAGIVAGRRDVSAVPVQAGCVGAARAAGVDAAAVWSGRAAAPRVWIANTDADSTVPEHWLVDQVRFATAGLTLVVGTVEPTAGDLTAEEMVLWRARHSVGDGHQHVHGANLGFTLAAYRAVGGFRPLRVHEDVELVAAMRADGVATVATGSLSVTTSGRRHGRAPDGFAAYLDGLGA